jgi:hypothetical protein
VAAVGTIWAQLGTQTGAIQENYSSCYSAGKRRGEALTSGRAEGSNPSAAIVTVEKSQVKSYFGACCELSRAPLSHEVRR